MVSADFGEIGWFVASTISWFRAHLWGEHRGWDSVHPHRGYEKLPVKSSTKRFFKMYWKLWLVRLKASSLSWLRWTTSRVESCDGLLTPAITSPDRRAICERLFLADCWRVSSVRCLMIRHRRPSAHQNKKYLMLKFVTCSLLLDQKSLTN